MILKRPKRAVLNAKAVFILLAIVSLLTMILVVTLGHKSIFTEINITLSIISVSLFLFITISLYIGVKIKIENKGKVGEKLKENINNTDHGNMVDTSPVMLDASPDILADIPDDPIGLILAGLVWIGITIGAIIALSGFFTVIWAVIASLFAMIYWVFYKALRRVFSKTKICIGNLKQSIMYGLYYTLIYCGWIYVIAFVSRMLK